MNFIIYGLCAITALICTFLMVRAYLISRYRLLLWSSWCFAGLTLNNIVLMFDKIVFGNDLLTLRLAIALAALLPLVYGLIFEDR
ncbi:MAG TPA: DUF5985 family protein [Methylophilaceae bacterium]|nr:DUF5985 family protein [Methylophilaceae bacterium]